MNIDNKSKRRKLIPKVGKCSGICIKHMFKCVSLSFQVVFCSVFVVASRAHELTRERHTF